MTSTLETAVDAIITRVCEMELLALADQTQAPTIASKKWMHIEQQFPYWSNRPFQLANNQQNHYTLGITGRLWLAHTAQINVGAEPVQEAQWGYMAATIAYFEQYDMLRPPDNPPTTYAEIINLDPIGTRISCPRGLDYTSIPLGQGRLLTAFYLDFDITVPMIIFG